MANRRKWKGPDRSHLGLFTVLFGGTMENHRKSVKIKRRGRTVTSSMEQLRLT